MGDNSRRIALAAEMKRRGLLPSESPSLSGTDSEDRQERIKAEMMRRGLLALEKASSTESSPSPSLLTEIPEAVGKGALSGALKTGMGLATADPMAQEMKIWMQTQDDLAPYAEQHDQILTAGNQELAHRDEETLKNLHSPLSRMAWHGGDWMGSGIVTPGGNVLKGAKAVSTMPSLVKEVAKRLGLSLGKDATMGATSGMLQEGEVNPLVADIMAPVVTAVGKKSWQGGKWVFSPEYRKEVARPGAEKEIGGILRETTSIPPETKTPTLLTPSGWKEAWQEVKHDYKTRQEPSIPYTDPTDHHHAMNVSHDLNVPEHLHPLESHQVLPHEAGNDVRQFFLNKLDTLYRKRSKKTDPLIKELKEIKEGLEPVHAREIIAKKLETAKGNVRGHLERAEKELQANNPIPDSTPLTHEQQKKLDLYKTLLGLQEHKPGYNPKNPNLTVLELRKQIQALEGTPSSTKQPTPLEIKNAREWLNDEISSAYKDGKGTLAHELTEVRDAVDKVMESLPQGSKYVQEYKKHSTPINEIEEHRTLGKMVGEKKNTYSRQYILSDSQIPAQVVGISLKSVDDAKDLMKHLKGKQGEVVRKSLEGTINKSLLDVITDEHGKVSTAKIHTWKKNHPGAFVLYPSLETRLKNLANAQYFTDTLLGKSRNLSVLEAYQSLPLHLFKKLFRKIPAGGKVVDVVHKALGKEKDVLRQELLDKALKDPETARILMTPVREEGKLEKYLQGGIRMGARMMFRNHDEKSGTS